MSQNNDQPTAVVHRVTTLIETLRSEADQNKRTSLFRELLDAITDHYGTRPPTIVHEAIIGLFDHEQNDGSDCIKLGYYFECIERYDDAIAWYHRSYNKDQNYKSLSNLATLHSYLNNYKESLKYFEQCLKMEIVDPAHLQRITYNYGFTLNLVGHYKKANSVFSQLTKLFENTTKEKHVAEYWIDYGDHCLYNLLLPFDAVEKYEAGLSCDELTYGERVELLLGLVNACYKCVGLLFLDDAYQLSVWKRKAKSYLATALHVINENEPRSHVKLGELHFYSRHFEEAIKCYEELIRQDKSSIGEEKGDVYHFLGLCYLYSENYEVAINYFNQSVHTNHPTFTKVYLATCYLHLKKFSEAEDLLDGVLSIAPHNTNALTTQIFLYRDWGESIKTSNAEKAIDFLYRSVHIASLLLEQSDEETFQRPLLPKEVFELKYTISYCHIEIYNLIKSKAAKCDALKLAKTHLTELGKSYNNSYYFKATRTLHEVEKILDDYHRSSFSRERPLTWFAVLAVTVAFILLFFGKPLIHTGYQLDTTLLAAQIKIPAATIDSSFRDKRFSDLSQMTAYVQILYADRIPKNKGVVIAARNAYLEIDAEKVDTAIIALLLSAALVFVLLGLVSNEVKVLKVGAIHIEKGERATLMDQIELKMTR